MLRICGFLLCFRYGMHFCELKINKNFINPSIINFNGSTYITTLFIKLDLGLFLSQWSCLLLFNQFLKKKSTNNLPQECASRINLMHQIVSFHRRFKRASKRNCRSIINKNINTAKLFNACFDCLLNCQFIANINSTR